MGVLDKLKEKREAAAKLAAASPPPPVEEEEEELPAAANLPEEEEEEDDLAAAEAALKAAKAKAKIKAKAAKAAAKPLKVESLPPVEAVSEHRAQTVEVNPPPIADLSLLLTVLREMATSEKSIGKLTVSLELNV